MDDGDLLGTRRSHHHPKLAGQTIAANRKFSVDAWRQRRQKCKCEGGGVLAWSEKIKRVAGVQPPWLGDGQNQTRQLCRIRM
jgi:hypothetical protein